MEHLPLGKQSHLIPGKDEGAQCLALNELNSPRYVFSKSQYTACLGEWKSRGRIALFLDFDGTLVPIGRDPTRCFLSEETKKLLRLLASSEHFYLAVISGRSLSDLKRRVRLRKVFYAGNHGLDIQGPELRYTHPKALATKRVTDQVKLRLIDAIKGFEGAWLEDKKFTLSLHFRSVGSEQTNPLKDAFHRATREWLDQNTLSILRGKKVLELIPTVSWNKGKAALWILQGLEKDCLPVYIGDDQTDEAAFEVLREIGISVRVGKSERTSAEYYLKGQWEVSRILRSFKDLWPRRGQLRN